MRGKEKRWSRDPKTEMVSRTKQDCSGERQGAHSGHAIRMSFGVADPYFRVDQDRQRMQIAVDHENNTAAE